jgi:DNA-binding NtrC family response regulator
VVTDLKMPRRDGLGLLEWTREHRPGLPVVVITAFGSIESAVDALKAGAFDYVTKPFDQEDLRATVEAALDESGEAARQSDAGGLDLKTFVRAHTERLERHRIRQALHVEDGNVTRAARKLGISRRSLQTKMKDYGLRED